MLKSIVGTLVYLRTIMAVAMIGLVASIALLCVGMLAQKTWHTGDRIRQIYYTEIV